MNKISPMYQIALSTFLCMMFEPQRQKAHLRTCAHSEDSDQTAHSRSLIRTFTGRTLDRQECRIQNFFMRTTKTLIRLRMRRLIWVVVGRFVVRRHVFSGCRSFIKLQWQHDTIYLFEPGHSIPTASVQFDQFSLPACRHFGCLATHRVSCEDWSDCADA